MEEANSEYVIRLPKNRVLADKISEHLIRPKGEDSSPDEVKRIYKEFQHKSDSWDKERRVIAKIEWPPGELLPKFDFIVTILIGLNRCSLPKKKLWLIRLIRSTHFLKS